MLFMVAVVVNYFGNRTEGIRILDTQTCKTMDVPYENVVNVIESNKAKIENLRVSNGKLEGYNGSIDRYTKVGLKRGAMSVDSFIIISKAGTNTFICGDYTGKVCRVSEAGIVDFVNKGIVLANGKIVNGRVSAIEGSYVDTSSTQQKINEYEAKCAVLGIKPFKIERRGNDYMLVGVSEDKPECKIPRLVTRLGSEAFKGIKNIQKIIIPDSVTTIDAECFKWCESLIEVTLPNSISKIGAESFGWCKNLTTVNIPNSVNDLGEACFRGCKSLRRIIIPSSVKVIGKKAFADCESLEALRIAGNSKVCAEAFASCKKLKEIELADTIEFLDTGAFEHCESVKTIKLPSALKTISQFTFSGCYSIKRVTIPNGVKSVEENAFSHCTELAEAEIPESVGIIKGNAFMGCRMLKKINIPNTIVEIGVGAFDGTGIKNLKVPKSIKKLDRYILE